MNSKKTRRILVSGEYVLCGPGERIISQGAVAVEDGRIKEVGVYEDIRQKYKDFSELRRPSGLVMPGLINAHTHAPMVLFRGMADDLPLKTWLEDHIFPAEARLNQDLIALGTELACAEMIRSGTTGFIDMYLFEETIARVTDRVGMRAWLGEGIFDFPSPSFPSGQDALRETERLSKAWEGNPRITITVDPHTPYTCNQALLEDARELASSLDLHLVIHLAETRWEIEEITRIHGCSPVEYLDSLGLLSPRLLAVHCVWLSERDMDILSERGVSIAHCPESNLKLGSGIAPVARLLKKNVRVALGTDGAASNNDLDMFGEMDTAAKLPKGLLQNPSVVSAAQVLSMATVDAALAMGRTDLGRLSPGYQADIIILDLDRPTLRPCYNCISQVVYAAKGGDVTDVMVGGDMLMIDGKLVTIDEKRLLAEVKAWRKA
ncbi:MAG: hypothetical protein DSZ23_05540 [Thermodesulfatator sp.]|nr:MAG: hypothetical protein DSZ23_05540 [Thermodesulfatator sp.]